MQTAVARLSGLTSAARLLGALGLVALTGALDRLPGVAISFLPAYTLAVAFAAWFLPLGRALLVAVAAAALAAWSDLHPGEPTRAGLDAMLRLGVFVALQGGMAALRASFDSQTSDSTTGVAGRGAFLIAAATELRRARRYKRPLTVLLLDIDGFHLINERIGRYAGDAVLRSAAQALTRMQRSTDVVARVGGDSFALLLTETGFAGAAGALEKLRAQLPAALERGPIRPTFCTGAVTFTAPPDSMEALLSSAEHALERAQARGVGSLEHDVVTPHTAPVASPEIA
jgi:diguanylate cyclase (GGDEF)-like protein